MFYFLNKLALSQRKKKKTSKDVDFIFKGKTSENREKNLSVSTSV